MTKQTQGLTRNISRRAALKGLSATGAVALCTPFIGKAEAATLELRGLIWEPYNQRDMVKAFEKEHGVKVSFSYFDGNAEAFNQFRSGGTKDFDMVMADGHWPKTYFENELTQPLDSAKLPNLANVFEGFQPPQSPLHMVGDTRIAAPNCWGGIDVIYNKSMMSDEDAHTMWALFNPDYAGKLTTMARYEETIAWAGILVANELGTINDARPDGKAFNPYVLTDEELVRCTEILIEQKKLLLTRYQDLDMMTRLLKTRQVAAGPGGTLSYAPLYYDFVDGKQDWEPGYALDSKEGGLAWIDTWLISSGVEHDEVLEVAHKWIDTFLTKENMANIVKETGFSSTVDCREHLSDLEIGATLMDQTDAMASKYMFDTPSSPEAWEKVWSTVEAS
ncbi:ABC transporter substrate-binding protein [Celeribacter sp. SCSIO 80788]|jgi:spermidine/putrescine-binding protein|uniref:ABC transporter substrate-binding protein n=1 Tax=Celeribacter sp. SCSIO 80788 TaxID=3117013 RepID=UPI003DA4027A